MRLLASLVSGLTRQSQALPQCKTGGANGTACTARFRSPRGRCRHGLHRSRSAPDSSSVHMGTPQRCHKRPRPSASPQYPPLHRQHRTGKREGRGIDETPSAAHASSTDSGVGSASKFTRDMPSTPASQGPKICKIRAPRVGPVARRQSRSNCLITVQHLPRTLMGRSADRTKLGQVRRIQRLKPAATARRWMARGLRNQRQHSLGRTS